MRGFAMIECKGDTNMYEGFSVLKRVKSAGIKCSKIKCMGKDKVYQSI